MLPSSICGSTTETVGFFACQSDELATWLANALGPGWRRRSASVDSFEALCELLTPGNQLRRHALLEVEGWTAVLTDGPIGTDLGMVPSLAARELRSTAIRATRTDSGTRGFQAVVLEVFDPATEDSLRCRRSIAAADDGGRWTFEQFGSPFDFEQVGAYSRRRVRDRFTPEMLTGYLEALGVPFDSGLDLRNALMIEREEEPTG